MTTRVLTLGELPHRLEGVGWKRPLYVRGTLCEGPAVAIVGARAATTVAMERAHAIGRHLARLNVHVVSGGAIGIDGAAHRGALAGGGTTTVVLGSGTDVHYPERHAPLFRAALENGGAIVSLLPDGTLPRRGTFLARNPLIAALVDAVIVVEADVRSGSLATARAAREMKRILAAWPGSQGCDRLLGEGAAIVESIQDAELVAMRTPRFYEPEIDPDVQHVREAMRAGATSVHAIARHTGLTLRAVLRAIPQLSKRCS